MRYFHKYCHGFKTLITYSKPILQGRKLHLLNSTQHKTLFHLFWGRERKWW